MNIDYTARRQKLDPKVREIVEKRFVKLAKVLPPDALARVVLRSEKRGVGFEITVTARQRTWTAEASAEDQLTAIHEVLDRIALQVKKNKAKVKEEKKHTESGVRAPIWREAAAEPRPRRSSGRRTETVEARPQFDEDALHKFADSKKDVLPYRDPSDDSLKVLYRRRDGSIGLLIPV